MYAAHCCFNKATTQLYGLVFHSDLIVVITIHIYGHKYILTHLINVDVLIPPP